MKHQDLIKHHHLSIPELKLAIGKLEDQLVETRLKTKLGQEKNLHSASNLRRDIAQLKTIVSHKQLTGQPATTQKPPKSEPTTKKTKKVIKSKKEAEK